MHKLVLFGIVLILVVIVRFLLHVAEENPRIGVVIGWTRCLVGLDYDKGIFALFVGPFAFCLAWGNPDNNPFISQEKLDAMAKEHDDASKR